MNKHEYGESVLQHFGLTRERLLGSGGESSVYALDDARVLRIYAPSADRRYIDAVSAFYAELDDQSAGFHVPVVETVDALDGTLYAIEQRITGSSLAKQMPSLKGEHRRIALINYTRAVEAVHQLTKDAGSLFGEFLTPEPLQRNRWSEFLSDRAELTLQRSRPRLDHDIPQLNKVLNVWKVQLSALDDVTQPQLVHGDYFPGNVMVDDQGQVIAVIDFSPMTVAGDPRMDFVGALIYLEVVEGYQSADSDLVQSELIRRHGRELIDLVPVYRTYYSLYFSTAYDDDPKLYRWCLNNLRHELAA